MSDKKEVYRSKENYKDCEHLERVTLKSSVRNICMFDGGFVQCNCYNCKRYV